MIATHITQNDCSVLSVSEGIYSRCAYTNSTEDRAKLLAISSDIENYTEVVDVWGSEPTVIPAIDDMVETSDPQPTISELQQRIAELEAALDALIGGESA